MGTQPNTRLVDRQRRPAPLQRRGYKQVVLPMTRVQYDQSWHDPQRTRQFVEAAVATAAGLFPAGFDLGYRLHGFGRTSRKLPGLKL